MKLRVQGVASPAAGIIWFTDVTVQPRCVNHYGGCDAGGLSGSSMDGQNLSEKIEHCDTRPEKEGLPASAGENSFRGGRPHVITALDDRLLREAS